MVTPAFQNESEVLGSDYVGREEGRVFEGGQEEAEIVGEDVADEPRDSLDSENKVSPSSFDESR
jgi:hypothetical protein